MTTLIVAPSAQADLAAIQRYLRAEAGINVAQTYALRFLRVFEQLEQFPGSGAPRSEFGAQTRIVIVPPYLAWYEFDEATDTVHVLRVLHGKQDVTQTLLRS
jgi:plasmid stabilization system protein ParE